MSTYTTAIRRSVLCLVALVLIVPLVSKAAEFSDPQSLPLLKSMKVRVWVTTTADVPIKAPVYVKSGADFKINWEAVGKDAADQEVRTSPKLRCANNWSGDYLPKGSTVGSIAGNKTFVITCYGLGGAKTVRGTVKVGTIDLISSLSVAIGTAKNVTKGTFSAGLMTFKGAVKNLGKLQTPPGVPVEVNLYYSNSADMAGKKILPQGMPIKSAEVNGSAIVKIAEFPWPAGAGPASWYYQACVDENNRIAESDETNNCSKPIGPFKFQ